MSPYNPWRQNPNDPYISRQAIREADAAIERAYQAKVEAEVRQLMRWWSAREKEAVGS